MRDGIGTLYNHKCQVLHKGEWKKDKIVSEIIYINVYLNSKENSPLEY